MSSRLPLALVLIPLLAVPLLTGCPRTATPPPIVTPQPAPTVVVRPEQAARTPLQGVLGSAGWLITLPRERQQEEVERLARVVERDDLPTDRLRLALLLALGDEAIRDAERVRTLLHGQGLDDDTLASETLIRLVLEVVETRSTSDAERLRLALALEQERERREEVEAKLDALRVLEVEMQEREVPEAETGGGGSTPDRTESP